MESKHSKEDTAYIDAGIDEPDKIFRKSVIDAAILLNGANDAAQPGVAVSYIPEENYYYRINVRDLPLNQLEIFEQALNWNAIGKGKGGIAGAAVRWRLREFFIPTRECRTIEKLDDSHKALVKDYILALNANRQTSSVWFSNAWNVMGLAVSCFIRESHHWDANNFKPIKALLGSLNQEDEIPENEYRKLFYLSIHPIPLNVMSLTYFKSCDPLDQDISATVKTRLNVAPSGYADICACAIAAESFLHEDFAKRCILFKDIVRVLNAAKQLKANPISYHPFSSQMGVTHVDFVKSPLIEAMIVLGAYAKSCIGGTLADSPALKKFLDLHARKANKLVKGFVAYNERKSDDLIRILTGSESSEIEIVGERIKPLAKLAEKLRNMSTDPNDAIAGAAKKVDLQIAKLVENVGGDQAEPVESVGDLIRDDRIVPFVLPADLAKLFNVNELVLQRVADAALFASKK